MKHLKYLLLLVSNILFSQWEPLNITEVYRYDDVFFIDENIGWAAGGGTGLIFKTTNGGSSWEHVFTSEPYGSNSNPRYLRSIEFATPSLGFAGSLFEHLYKTTDGGETWQNISDNIPFNMNYNGQELTHISGICGLSAPSSSTIYGCGVWGGGPAFIIKTMDGGDTWTSMDMTDQASQLVEIFFVDELEGFVSGVANPREDGGVILHTTDGGENWEVVYKTMTNGDYVWKIQTPDSVNFFGSIQGLPYTENVRFTKSTNLGATWSTMPVNNEHWNHIQMIGFKDSMTGWTGGTHSGEFAESEDRSTVLYKTNDGGLSWNTVYTGSNSTFNRFFLVNEESIYMSGQKIYKYNPNILSSGEPSNEISHTIKVLPNPSNGRVEVKINILQMTRCQLNLVNSQGKVIADLFDGIITSGEHSFKIEILEAGVHFVNLHTNEGLICKKLIVK